MLLVNLLGALHQLGVFGRESLELSGQLVSAFLGVDEVGVDWGECTPTLDERYPPYPHLPI